MPKIQAACDSLRQAPSISERVFQSVACRCGLCQEVGSVILNDGCNFRANAETPVHYQAVSSLYLTEFASLIIYGVSNDTEISLLPLKKGFLGCLMLFGMGNTDCGHILHLSESSCERYFHLPPFR